MIDFYKPFKKILFKLDPETAHHTVLQIAHLGPVLGTLTGIKPSSRHAVNVGSLKWRFPVGLAAGLDKDARALSFFHGQGFGAIECGTLTLNAQQGNNRPRLFRYPQEQSLRNSMGFPNSGAIKALTSLKSYEETTPLGVNIGKHKNSDREKSISELKKMVKLFSPYVSYFTINVSSPNTPGLREMQDEVYLKELFSELIKIDPLKKPEFYLKISPDMEQEQALNLLYFSQEMKLTGIIATNTTHAPERGLGGMSGLFLKNHSSKIWQCLLKEKEKEFEVIGVGGFSQFNDLLDFWLHGGKVIQVYTSYIYQGPTLLKHFYSCLDQFLQFQKLSLEDFFQRNEKERVLRIQDFISKSPLS